ncbi:MAG: hypothetical protein ACI8P7_000402 [Candidatus Azotimanducaceae bacterium]|jgi:hypothetical protein
MKKKKSEFDLSYSDSHTERFAITQSFIKKYVQNSDRILDIGPLNPFSRILASQGYQVDNTPEDVDLDLHPEITLQQEYDIVTAFEIFEHLVSPFPILKDVKSNLLIASVPLKLWFSDAYWNDQDPYDRHYHEFEPKQFDMLLEKAGWKIIDQKKWKSYSRFKIGVRPILRKFTDRYYLVVCERNNKNSWK